VYIRADPGILHSFQQQVVSYQHHVQWSAYSATT